MLRIWTVLTALNLTTGFAAEKTWQNKMSELSAAMSETIPYLFPDPNKDVKGLTEKVKRLRDITQDLDVKTDHMRKAKDFDPALPYLASLFKEDIDRAYVSLQEGHIDYAKAVLRSSSSYCIACHTRTKGGAEFPLLAAYAQPLKGASWITTVEFLAASRQFDSVLSQVMSHLSSGKRPGINALDLEKATRIALSVAIRVKQDPDKALALARAVAESPSASFSMKEGAKRWDKDIREWKKEKSKKFDSPEMYMKAAKDLMAKAQKSNDLIGGHDEVSYLRVTVYMYDLLKAFPDSNLRADAFYLIGVSYNYLQDLGLWTLQDKYFQACILESPHSQTSVRCFNEYEKSITLGFSGSSGIHIPRTVQKHLETLKAKAALQ